MIKAIDIARMIDHSLLRPEFTLEQVIDGLAVAKRYETATVCVRPCDVSLAARKLAGTSVLVSTVIGFPHGTAHSASKVFEAEQAIRDGAVELDMVMNYSRLLSGEDEQVAADIKAVVDVAHRQGAIVKVILENCYLTDELKVKACQICEAVGADFVKTSTGFGSGGATLDDLRLMRRTVSEKVRVKAAGGVRTLDQLLAARAAGAVRCGATATEAIMNEALAREQAGTLVELDDETGPGLARGY